MKALEWNPSFGPFVSALVILGVGAYFFLLFRRMKERHGMANAWLLLAPKVALVALLILALLDPDFKLSGNNALPAKVLILQDVSASMDLKDDGSTSRSDRAALIVQELQSAAPATFQVQVLPFDISIHEPGYVAKPGADRGTDLAAIFMALATQPKLADADGIIVVTDGGDETVEPGAVPTQPLGIVGVGASPDGWNDIGIGNVTAPASVEENSQFDLQADLYARPETHSGLDAVKVDLEQGHDKTWTPVQTQTISLASMHAAVVFHVQVTDKGSLRYRIKLPELPGELTYANNTRVVNVEVQQRALHVLYFTQELGVGYKYLRAELGSDPGVAFTAMYRVLQDQFTVQGDRTGYQDLANGFPDKDDILKRYDCVILGSFPANQLTDAQSQNLLRYVENGGALILLGGDASFGRGGYAESKLSPLIPWMVTPDEPDPASGSFPVTVSASAAAVEFTSGLREDINAAGGASVESLNRPGGLRPGAVGLLDATIANRAEPIVAWQRYGKGQVLGIATNTMWKWAAEGGASRALYGRFFRQAVRGLTKKLEGGALLGIHWNQDHYRPGEEAAVTVTLRESGDSGTLRLVGGLSGPGGDKEIGLAPVTGQAGTYTAKIPLPQRGDYTFRISAYSGTTLAESYERTLPVEPLLDEGASPELKDTYLKAIAARARGVYTYEKDLKPMEAFLREQIVSQQSTIVVPAVNFWNIFPFLVIIILVGEWFLRRRFNLI
jgi:uncharacterized membrane protein